MKTRNKGLILSFVGVLILSPDSLFIRLVNLDDFSLIFYRSALPIVTILIFLIYTYKRSFLKSFYLIGVPGIIYAILKEIPSLFTWIVILIAMLAMIIIGIGSFTTMGLYGDIMALIVAIGMGFSMVLVRLFKNKDLVPACLLGCLISALYALPFGINFDLNNDQILFLFIMCLLILPIPFMILTISPKFAPAHEVALIFLLESVLGTAWVWFVINEIPPLNTIIGGALLLGSVTIFIYQTTRNTN